MTSSRKSSPNQNTTKMRVPSESQLFRRAAREGVGPYGSTDAPSRPSWPMCWDTQRRRALSVTGLGNLHKFRRFPTESRQHWCRPARVTVYFRCQTYLLYLGGRIMLNVADGGVWAASRKHVDGCGVGRIPSETVEPKCKWVWRTQLAADPRPRSSPGNGRSRRRPRRRNCPKLPVRHPRVVTCQAAAACSRCAQALCSS